MDLRQQNIQRLLDQSLSVVRLFEEIIDSYVLDFYTENHWNKLPSSWKRSFDCRPLHVFNELLNATCEVKTIWPLSILALKNVIKRLSLPRTLNPETRGRLTEESEFSTHPKLKNCFQKQMKPKKIHEVNMLSTLCAENARRCSTKYIVDFGAGVGHLARRLSFGYHLKVCCIEMQASLNNEARQIDQKFFDRGSKFLDPSFLNEFVAPVHLTMKLTNDTTPNFFLTSVQNAFELNDSKDFAFGIVGLHPCGDLSAILLKLFSKLNEAKFLNVVGCCYMKLTTNSPIMQLGGYPLSQYLLNSDNILCKLSYESLEVACHAIEHYSKKLETNNYEDLKIHAYRAVIERILSDQFPQCKHAGLRSVKNVQLITFSEYAKAAVAGMEVVIDENDLLSQQIKLDLANWERVVVFYTMRLIFAPLVESIVLYDRILFLLEKGFDASIEAIFDPNFSPRNQALISSKASSTCQHLKTVDNRLPSISQCK